MVYVTRALVQVLLDFAEDADPEAFIADLAVTPAGELDDVEELLESTDCSPETPVFTDFYHPETGRSVTAVFGMNLSTPPGGSQGRFISHPMGELSVSRTDDLHEVMLVAVPPWDEASLAAFDRSGRRQPLDVVDATPPEEPFTERTD